MLQNGILHESSCVYRPTQNRVAKRKNRHLLELHRYLVSRDVTFYKDLPYLPITTYRHQEENDDLLVYVSPTLVENTKQSAKLDGLPLKVYDSAPGEACGKSDAPSDALSGFDSPSPFPTHELDLHTSLWKDLILVLKNVGEALAHSRWRAAMIEEMNALDHN
nr:cysteine-rich RLK (receptor-like protein kinase) 8 [Tanacetum cinerariifolium]